MVVYGSFRNKCDEDYFAVFDGHSGTAASIFASKVVYVLLSLTISAPTHNFRTEVGGCGQKSSN